MVEQFEVDVIVVENATNRRERHCAINFVRLKKTGSEWWVKHFVGSGDRLRWSDRKTGY